MVLWLIIYSETSIPCFWIERGEKINTKEQQLQESINSVRNTRKQQQKMEIDIFYLGLWK
jgi:hypothetical protein